MDSDTLRVLGLGVGFLFEDLKDWKELLPAQTFVLADGQHAGQNVFGVRGDGGGEF